MKRMMIVLIAMAFLAGCSESSRNMIQGSGEGSAKDDNNEQCSAKVTELMSGISASTIKAQFIKAFFADVLDECSESSVAVEPVASFIKNNVSITCPSMTAAVIAQKINAVLEGSVDKTFGNAGIFVSSALLCNSVPVDNDAELNPNLNVAK